MSTVLEEADQVFPREPVQTCKACGLAGLHTADCPAWVEEIVVDILNARKRRIIARSALRNGQPIESPLDGVRLAILMYESAGWRANGSLWRKVLEQLQVRLQNPAGLNGLPRRSSSVYACFVLVAGVTAVQERESGRSQP